MSPYLIYLSPGTAYNQLVDFLLQKSIFQSPLFAEFQRKVPYRGKTFFIEVGDEGGKISAHCIRITLKRYWSWLWIPYGPVVEGNPNEKTILSFCAELKKLGREQRAVFTRIEPGAHSPRSLIETIRSQLFIRPSAVRFTPDHTLVLDLKKSDEELLKEMKPKGRYNIKVAQKSGVLVKQYSSTADIPTGDFAAWHTIIQETGDRDGFNVHGKAYYAALLDTLGSKSAASIFIAYNAQKQPVGGALVTYHDNVGMYYYGASAYEHRSLMAPYLVQWTAIQEARARGCEYYDLLGVSPPNSPNHHWAGVTDFKEKFGGVRYEYAPAFDIIHRPIMYAGYRLSGFLGL